MSEVDTPTAKVLFRVPNEDGSAEVETLWAHDLGQDRYRLDNSPFFAYSVSWQDIVHAPYSDEEKRPTFLRVVQKSGHRTVRVLFEEPVESGKPSPPLLQGLVSLGCSYGGADRRLMVIDIPPGIELEVVRQYLIERHATWEHADPTYEELFPQES